VAAFIVLIYTVSVFGNRLPPLLLGNDIINKAMVAGSVLDRH
jgi:hypothetical protein